MIELDSDAATGFEARIHSCGGKLEASLETIDRPFGRHFNNTKAPDAPYLEAIHPAGAPLGKSCNHQRERLRTACRRYDA